MKRFAGRMPRCALLMAAAVVLAAAGCTREVAQPLLPPLDAPPPPLGVGTPGGYRLQPGDLLRVKFLYHPELDIRLPVRPDGSVTVPMVGDVRAAGMTAQDLAHVIEQRTSDRLRSPVVSVVVEQLAQLKVYVGGEVRTPGFVAYTPGLTALQAIMDRGGFTQTARIDSVVRVSAVENAYQGSRLDFSKPLSNGGPVTTQLSAGDVLYVPRTFIGDVDTFVELYVRNVLPVSPHVGAATIF
jgi:polysaccharide biosynthesis/export protein PslD